MHIGPHYHRSAFNPDKMIQFTNIACKLVSKLRTLYPQLGGIAGMGHSGVTMVGPIAMMANLNPILVRKEGERGVMSGVPAVTGSFTAGMDYLIVDDLVSSGSSVARIMSKIEVEYQNRVNALTGWDDGYKMKEALRANHPRCIGVVLYNPSHENAHPKTPVPTNLIPDWELSTFAKQMPHYAINREAASIVWEEMFRHLFAEKVSAPVQSEPLEDLLKSFKPESLEELFKLTTVKFVNPAVGLPADSSFSISIGQNPKR